MDGYSRFIRNALFNLVRGGAGILVALALPHFLTRSLSPARFAVWALMLQFAAYANYLDFGLQTAISRFVAQTVERRETERQDQLIVTSVALLGCAGAAVYALMMLVVSQLPHIFHQVPAGLYREFQTATLVLSGSAVLVTVLSSFPSTLLGLQRNDLVTAAIGTSRLAGAFAAIFAAHYTQSLTVLALCIGCANLIGALLQIVMVKRLLPAMRLRWSGVNRSLANELIHYCAGLTVWNVGLLIVSGLDLILVGHYRFAAVGSYSIALTAGLIFAGINSYSVTALLAPLAVLHARRDMQSIVNILVGITAVDVLANGMVALLTFVLAKPLLAVWVGPYAATTLPLLEILMVAQAIRLSGLTFSITLVAIGEQNKGMAQGWVEALVNFVCSIIGILWIGPIGVAWGTLIGACCNFGWIGFVTIRKVDMLSLKRKTFWIEGVLKPLACLLPLAAVIVALFRQVPAVRYTGVLFALGGSVMLAWKLLPWSLLKQVRIGKAVFTEETAV